MKSITTNLLWFTAFALSLATPSFASPQPQNRRLDAPVQPKSPILMPEVPFAPIRRKPDGPPLAENPSTDESKEWMNGMDALKEIDADLIEYLDEQEYIKSLADKEEPVSWTLARPKSFDNKPLPAGACGLPWNTHGMYNYFSSYHINAEHGEQHCKESECCSIWHWCGEGPEHCDKCYEEFSGAGSRCQHRTDEEYMGYWANRAAELEKQMVEDNRRRAMLKNRMKKNAPQAQEYLKKKLDAEEYNQQIQIDNANYKLAMAKFDAEKKAISRADAELRERRAKANLEAIALQRKEDEIKQNAEILQKNEEENKKAAKEAKEKNDVEPKQATRVPLGTADYSTEDRELVGDIEDHPDAGTELGEEAAHVVEENHRADEESETDSGPETDSESEI